jgi:hypothetical protein
MFTAGHRNPISGVSDRIFMRGQQKSVGARRLRRFGVASHEIVRFRQHNVS